MTRLALVLSLVLMAAPVTAGEAEDRKARSVAVLQAEGVPILDSLPLIETEAISTRRTKEEVVQRAVALAIVAVKGETRDAALGNALITQFDASDFFTPDERAFMDAPTVSDADQLKFTWRYEGVHVMLWALGIYDDLGRPDRITDMPRLAATLRDLGAEGLRAQGTL